MSSIRRFGFFALVFAILVNPLACFASGVTVEYQLKPQYSLKIWGSMTEGLAIISQYGKYGFIDKDGNRIVPQIYSYAEEFSEGLACVAKAIRNGVLLIKPA